LEHKCNFIYSGTGYDSRHQDKKADCKYFHIEVVALSQRRQTPAVDLGGYVVYSYKMPAVMEGFKKIRVVFFKIDDWINDCICNINLIFYMSNISDLSRFFEKPGTTAG
jgi:hypothetical protein